MRKNRHHNRLANSGLTLLVYLLTGFALLALGFVIYFIFREALPLFQRVPLKDFLFNQRWAPIDYTGTGTSYGIFNFLAGTLLVSLLAVSFSFVVALGTALFLSCVAREKARQWLYPFIDLLAGIPSVIFGFVALTTLVKAFIKAGIRTGSCVLAASIVLSVMLLPYLTSSFSESIVKSRHQYQMTALGLGIDGWYSALKILIPASWKNILMSLILAIGRAMGETMAVMMVMGNANLFPRLLGKGETIATVIALEMGTAEGGSTHYHALYACGFVLLVLLLLINGGIYLIKNRLEKEQ